eukprot:Hpha_TRINITY_DN15223_c4_g8::TRINITY_DN15223_c4_g8_i1::g.67181::m.67181
MSEREPGGYSTVDRKMCPAVPALRGDGRAQRTPEEMLRAVEEGQREAADLRLARSLQVEEYMKKSKSRGSGRGSGGDGRRHPRLPNAAQRQPPGPHRHQSGSGAAGAAASRGGQRPARSGPSGRGFPFMMQRDGGASPAFAHLIQMLAEMRGSAGWNRPDAVFRFDNRSRELINTVLSNRGRWQGAAREQIEDNSGRFRANVGQLSEDNKKCPICLCEFEENQDVRMLPCMHLFHSDCVDRWLQSNRLCPTCKTDIVQMKGDAQRLVQV